MNTTNTKEQADMTNKPIKEYIDEFKCKLGLHKWGKWRNTSRFYDSGIGFGFGWIARLGTKCEFCGKTKEKEPVSESQRKQLIGEANLKQHD